MESPPKRTSRQSSASSLKAAKAALKQAHLNASVDTIRLRLGPKPGYVVTQSIAGQQSKAAGLDRSPSPSSGRRKRSPFPPVTAGRDAEPGGRCARQQPVFRCRRHPIMTFKSNVPAGDVIGSQPPSGKSVAQGTSVTLMISEGPAVKVPNLIGETPSSARRPRSRRSVSRSRPRSRSRRCRTLPSPAWSSSKIRSPGARSHAGQRRSRVGIGEYVAGTTGTGDVAPATTTTTTTTAVDHDYPDYADDLPTPP